MTRRTVFLDRDGTINREVDFVTHPDQLEVLPGVPGALQRLAAAGFRLVVVTNQSGIARGLYTERDLARVHDELQRRVAVPIDAWLHCPHLPDADGPYGGPCACRKPAAGMLHAAQELLDLSFDGAFLVGDSARDVLMARDLPIHTVLVRSGKPIEAQRTKLETEGFRPDAELDDLPAAVEWILAR